MGIIIDNPIAEKTYRLEKHRAIANGVLDTAYSTFLLLIAVRWFHAGPAVKSIVSGVASYGFLLAPFSVLLAKRSKQPIAKSLIVIINITTIFLLIAVIVPTLPVFVICTTLGLGIGTTVIPLFTQIYQDNYPSSIRGQLFSRSNAVRLLASSVFGLVAGYLLTDNLNCYQSLLLVFALITLATTLAVNKLPTKALEGDDERGILAGFRSIKHDLMFRRMLIVWWFMGFGNLMMTGLRVEFLANPKYGLQLSELYISILIAVIPNIARLILNPIWGKVFDRFNFFWLRIIVNLTFILAIFSFFNSNNDTGLIVGAIIYGVSYAGGDLLWSLWVTKMAPAEMVADYMSVHVFMTGLRGIIAPFVAFYLAAFLPITTVAVISALLIVLGSLFLVPEILEKRDLGRPEADISETGSSV